MIEEYEGIVKNYNKNTHKNADFQLSVANPKDLHHIYQIESDRCWIFLINPIDHIMLAYKMSHARRKRRQYDQNRALTYYRLTSKR
jgi:hypothetical protein